MKEYSKNEEEIKKLKLHVQLVKDELKNLKEHYYEVEEQTMLKVLDIPNVLHPKTPLKDEVVICHYLEKPDTSSESHKTIAESLGYLEHINKTTSFLKGEASLFEQAILNYLKTALWTLDLQFLSVVAEGCAEISNVFTIAELDSLKENLNHLHFCGGSTVLSFMAYFTKHAISNIHLPLKYFTIGKRYTVHNSEKPGITLSVFLATAENELMDLDHILKDVKTYYQKLGYHFRIVLLPANRIDKSESLHVSIQMYSNYLNDYVEVGNLSSFDSYLSKRLLFIYNHQSPEGKQRRFPKIIAGTVLNVPKLLGCVLENKFDKTLLSPILNKYLFH
nr:unnamed protein product [Callosobruchus analis]